MGLESRGALRPSDHTSKDVAAALRTILDMNGGDHFRLVRGGHWGKVVCVEGCCRFAVHGTPQNGARHARQLLREARRCPRDEGDVRNKRRRA